MSKPVIKVFEALQKHVRIICLILNHHDCNDHLGKFLKYLWHSNTVRVCVDGGADDYLSSCYLDSLPFRHAPTDGEVYIDNGAVRDPKSLRKNGLAKQPFKLPDIVCGDFDSISPKSLKWFSTCGCRIVNTPDQNYNDFEKALSLISSDQYLSSVHSVCVLCPFSGRIDQTLSNISILLRSEKYLGSIPMYIYSNEDVSFVQRDTNDEWISFDANSSVTTNLCSIIPMVGKSVVSTRGLFWELTKQKLCFDDLISSSNAFKDEFQFDIKVSGSPVLITIGHKIALEQTFDQNGC